MSGDTLTVAAGARTRSTMTAVSVEVGLRMLRSAPVMGTAAAAEAAGVAIGDLVVGVERLRGRGRCDRLAAAAMTYPRIARFKKRRILGHRVCPPPVTLRSGWDTGIAAGDRVPGVARWARRSVELASAPRVAFTLAVAAPVSAAIKIVEQAHCPPAMAVGLAAGPVRAENCVVAGQAAFRYSLMSPPQQAVLTTWRCLSGWSEASVATGGR